MSQLRVIPFAHALHRPNLLLGGERKLVILSGIISFGLILSDISFLKFILAFGIWTVCIAILRLMAKHDPDLSKVYLRRLKYQAFYSAQSRALQ